MKLRFTRSETDPDHCSKVVDDRPLIPTPSEDDQFLTGANPLICKSKRELDSRYGMVNCKPVTTSRILTFRSYMVIMPNQIWEMPLSFINSFALMFLVNFRLDMCFSVSMVSSYLVEPHWIGAKNLLRYLRGTIYHGLRYTTGNMKLHDYSNANYAGSVEDH